MKKIYSAPETVCEAIDIHRYMAGFNSVTGLGTNNDATDLSIGGTNENEENEEDFFTDAKSRGGWDENGLW